MELLVERRPAIKDLSVVDGAFLRLTVWRPTRAERQPARSPPGGVHRRIWTNIVQARGTAVGVKVIARRSLVKTLTVIARGKQLRKGRFLVVPLAGHEI
jgi:hypothetical protein